VGKHAVHRRIVAGRLHRIHKGVYAVGRPTLTRHGHWMAAVLAFGDGAVLSHRTAAALWGLRQSAWKIDVTVPTWRRPRAGFWLHCSALDPSEITREDGIPVTTVARTIYDLARVVQRNQVVRAVEESERRGRFDLGAVEAVLERAGHRPGVPMLRSVLADYQDPPDTRSELERRFAALLRRSRLPAPHANVLVAGFVVDCFWPASKLVVELDSRGFHSSPRAFESDRLRDAKLQRAGYRVIRVTHARLRDDPGGILEDVRLLLG
jgi:very-short-patch-repair endonuclease